MDYDMMPPPAGSRYNTTQQPVGGHNSYPQTHPPAQPQYYHNTPGNGGFDEQQKQQQAVQLPSAQQTYKPNLSHRTNVNRPPPLSLNHLMFNQESSHSPHYDVNQSPLSHVVSSPHHVTNSPHIASPHVINSPHMVQQNQNGHMTPSHAGMYREAATHSPHPGTPYADPGTPYADPGTPYSTADGIHSPRHFNDPIASPHHSAYAESPHPGTPYVNSHPGTPVGYANSPHHVASPHVRSQYQHFFPPNVHLPTDKPPAQEPQQLNHFQQQKQAQGGHNSQESQLAQQHVSSQGQMLSTGPQGDTLLSAINISQSESDGLQDAPVNFSESGMDTEWSGNSQPSTMKRSTSDTSVPYPALFEHSTSDVDELLSDANFMNASNSMNISSSSSQSDVNSVGKDQSKQASKPRPKGRPTKSSLSSRAHGAVCQACGKTFNNSSALAKHKLTHSDERKYVCQLCSKAFKRQDHLNGHMMTHRTKKPYECTFENCTKSYCDARSLRRHLENHHNVPADAMYSLSLTNYGHNGASMYNSNPATPSPHASPSIQNSQSQFFRFDPGQPQPPPDYPQQYNRFPGGARPGDVTSPNYAQQQSPLSPQRHNVPTSPGGMPLQPWARHGQYPLTDPPKPVECSLCHKRFKNLPALNGHMRLHGGYVNIKKPEMKSPDPGGQEHHSLSSTHSSKLASTGGESSPPPPRPAHDHPSDGNKYVDNLQHMLRVSSINPQPAPTTNNNHTSHTQDQGNCDQGGVTQRLLQVHAGALASSAPSHNASQPQPPSHIQAPVVAGQAPVIGLRSAFPFSIADQRQQTLADLVHGHAAKFTPPVVTQHSDATKQFRPVNMAEVTTRETETPPEQRQPRRPDNLDLTARVIADRTDSKGQVEQKSSIEPETSTTGLARSQEQTQSDRDHFLSERKRHASADPDKFTSPRILNRPPSLTSPSQLTGQPLANVSQHWDYPRSSRRRRMSADGRHHSRYRSDILTSSDGAAIFRSPPPVGAKRRKNRPEPLVIPPNIAVVQSRLRSPRIWEHGEPVTNGGHRTPPPYTPPPILSPMRIGTGLFYGIHRPQIPLSASLPSAKLLASMKQHMSVTIPEESTPPVSDIPATVDTPPEEVEPADEIAPPPPPPETDILPHINIGPNHQADLPAFNSNHQNALSHHDHASILWDPSCLSPSISEQELTAYSEFSCCAAVPGSGCNKEYAMHLLHLTRGNLQRAIVLLMSQVLPPDVALDLRRLVTDYHYQESTAWSTEDIEAYTEAMMKCDKDFFAIAKTMDGRKDQKSCVEFYYLWKKICPDEYKRLRIIRRKKRNDELYNLRSKNKPAPEGGPVSEDDADSLSPSEPEDEPDDDDDVSDGRSSVVSAPPATWSCDFPRCNAVYSSKAALSAHARIHSAPKVIQRSRETSPAPKKVKQEFIPPPGSEEFPCKLCGKVFYKVKSRSAHMKSHSVLAKKAASNNH